MQQVQCWKPQQVWKDRKGHQRYRCPKCGKTFIEPHNGNFASMYTPTEKATAIIKLLVEGGSVRSIERLTDTHRDTILRVLVNAGERCAQLLEDRIQGVVVKDVQCDEMWGFVGCKEKRNILDHPERGDAYCFVAIERHNKLVLSWHLGKRTAKDTEVFIDKLDMATSGNFQISTDGFRAYPEAIHTALGTRVDYGQIIKVYGQPADDEHRYSPARVISAIRNAVWGNPDDQRICTSHIERQNLTMRMHIRRLTRLTNAFSKKWENLKAALALYFAWYNFCRIHKSLKMTPMMEAGLTTHVWTVEKLIGATRL